MDDAERENMGYELGRKGTDGSNQIAQGGNTRRGALDGLVLQVESFAHLLSIFALLWVVYMVRTDEMTSMLQTRFDGGAPVRIGAA